MNTDQPMPLEETIQAAKTMDWQQVAQNGGPPCFHLEDNGSFCGRAKVWQGHGSKHTHHHRFIPLDELLSTVSALHHLEAGKNKRYTPQDMIFAASFGIENLGKNFPELKPTHPTEPQG